MEPWIGNNTPFKQTMNLRKKSILDSLMFGSAVPQPDYVYFLEQERISEGKYKRIWFYLDAVCQRNHNHIPEKFEIRDETIIHRVKKTRNHKLAELLYNKIRTKSMGLVVEYDKDDDAIVS